MIARNRPLPLWLIFTGWVIALAGMAPAAPAAGWQKAVYAKVALALPAKPLPQEELAAAEFAAYWQRCTGHALVPAAEAEAVVFIGEAVLPESWRTLFAQQKPGKDGVFVHCSDLAGRPALALAGSDPQGTLNAVYVFFESWMGVRWLAPDLTHIPATPPPALPDINHSYTPPFEFRWMWSFLGRNSAQRQAFERASRIAHPDSGSHGHDFYELVPPDRYFASHPEYYALAEGKRVAPGADWRERSRLGQRGDDWAQLCMSNPDVPAAIMMTLRQWIAGQPNTGIWGVMQEDCYRYCRCEHCTALDVQEGGPMGSLLTGVNRVAEMVDREYPGKRIITFAYTYSRRPPLRLRAADNVIVQFCTIEADSLRRLEDPASRENSILAGEIKGWADKCRQLFIYDYASNFNAWFRPHPNLHVIQPNLAFFAEHQIKGAFIQACPEEKGGFTALRTYLAARVLWNPHIDGQAVIDEFLTLYYREAAPYVREYIALEKATAEKHGAVITCYDPGWWLDAGFVRQGRTLLAKAGAVAASPEVRERVKWLSLVIEYAAMSCPPETRIADGMIQLTRPEAMSVSAYLQLLEATGVEQVDEQSSVGNARARHFAKGFDLPRRESSPLCTLENDATRIWVAPALSGSVLRWEDKRRGRELLRGYQHFEAGPGTIQDWVSTPGEKEGPPAREYTVSHGSPERLVLTARTASGLQIERTMRLLADGGLEISVKLTNTRDTPQEANIKIHPEFHSQGISFPQIWCGNGTMWKHINKDIVPGEESHGSFSHGSYLPAEDYDRMAWFVPEQRIGMVCSFPSGEAATLLWYADASTPAQQVNLELIPPAGTLPPGRSRTLTATYRIFDAPPWDQSGLDPAKSPLP